MSTTEMSPVAKALVSLMLSGKAATVDDVAAISAECDGMNDLHVGTNEALHLLGGLVRVLAERQGLDIRIGWQKLLARDELEEASE